MYLVRSILYPKAGAELNCNNSVLTVTLPHRMEHETHRIPVSLRSAGLSRCIDESLCKPYRGSLKIPCPSGCSRVSGSSCTTALDVMVPQMLLCLTYFPHEFIDGET